MIFSFNENPCGKSKPDLICPSWLLGVQYIYKPPLFNLLRNTPSIWRRICPFLFIQLETDFTSHIRISVIEHTCRPQARSSLKSTLQTKSQSRVNQKPIWKRSVYQHFEHVAFLTEGGRLSPGALYLEIKPHSSNRRINHASASENTRSYPCEFCHFYKCQWIIFPHPTRLCFRKKSYFAPRHMENQWCYKNKTLV